MTLGEARLAEVIEIRAQAPETVAERAAERARRAFLHDDGKLFIIAADHPARRALAAGHDSMAMADRRELLDRIIRALRRPGVDGLLATPDVIEDLLVLGELDGKVLLGSMNRGGLAGSAWELDDRFTAYTSEAVARLGLDGGKMLLRLDYEDPATLETIERCAGAVTDLASRNLRAVVEPLPVRRDAEGRLRLDPDPDSLIEAIAVASALGGTSAYTWLKVPAPRDPARVFAATTLPCLMLGGDPGERASEVLDSWREGMMQPPVRGLVAGRSLLFPSDGNVERWVDSAAGIVHS